MALWVGALLAFSIGVMATVSRMDRDRAFYSTVAIVVASYYPLYAVLGGSTRALVLESMVGGVFMAAALLGFRTSMWIVAMALGGHGVFDLIHGSVMTNPGVPGWWPAFCSAYDVTAAGYLAWLIRSGRLRAAHANPSR